MWLIAVVVWLIVLVMWLIAVVVWLIVLVMWLQSRVWLVELNMPSSESLLGCVHTKLSCETILDWWLHIIANYYQPVGSILLSWSMGTQVEGYWQPYNPACQCETLAFKHTTQSRTHTITARVMWRQQSLKISPNARGLPTLKVSIQGTSSTQVYTNNKQYWMFQLESFLARSLYRTNSEQLMQVLGPKYPVLFILLCQSSIKWLFEYHYIAMSPYSITVCTQSTWG